MITKITTDGSNTLHTAGRRELRRIGRFTVIGSTSVVIDFVVYSFLAPELSTHVAKGISYVAGMVIGYFGNKYWVFESRKKSVAEPLTYVLLYTVTLAVNIAANGLVIVATGSTIVAFIFATGITTVMNFLGLRWVTFRIATQENERAQQTFAVRRAA